MEVSIKTLETYEKPVIEIVEFSLSEGIAESFLSGENLICIEEES